MLLSEEQIQIEALSLPAPARAELAERLLTSLNDESPDPVFREWIEVIRERHAAYLAGQVTPLSRDEAFSTARGTWVTVDGRVCRAKRVTPIP